MLTLCNKCCLILNKCSGFPTSTSNHFLRLLATYNGRYNINFLSTDVTNIIIKNTRYQSNRSNKDEIGSSTTVLQDGLNFQELPILIRKTNKIPDLEKNGVIEGTSENIPNYENEILRKIMETEMANIFSVSQVLQYLQLIPSSEITPSIAACILEKISAIHNNSPQPQLNEPFTERAVLKSLCETICHSSNTNEVLMGFEALNKLTKLSVEEKNNFCTIIVSECLDRINKGQLNLIQICRLIRCLSLAGIEYQNLGDNLWQEILSHESSINIDNISQVFDSLLYLKSSQKIVLSMLEKKVANIFPNLTEHQVVHMLKVIGLKNLSSYKLCHIVTAWAQLNIHKITEFSLRDILAVMIRMNYSDAILNRSISRFIKAKGKSCTDTMLMMSLAEYSDKFRWCCPDTMDTIADYFVRHAPRLNADAILVLVEVFGLLSYEPTNAYKFFEELEKILMERMNEFSCGAIIRILLSCIYVKRYPLNFARKIFRPSFLNQLDNEKDAVRSQGNLKLLDVALTLECPTYSGPYLPRKDVAKSLSRDYRILGDIRRLELPLSYLLGGIGYFRSFYKIPKLPLCETYLADFAINLDKDGKPIPFHILGGIEKRLLLFIMLPEYFVNCGQSTERLTGPQETRFRQLEELKYNVITLDHRLLDGRQEELLNYLKSRLGAYLTSKV